MPFNDENFLKSIGGLVALASGLITLFYFLVNRFIQVIATDEINKLFVDKVKQQQLKIWHFLLGLIYFIFLYVGSALVFNYYFSDSFNANVPGTAQNILTGSVIAFFVSSLILTIYGPYLNKLKRWNKTIIFLIIFNMITSIITYIFLFKEIINKNVDLNTISLTVFLPIALTSLYTFIISRINAQTQTKYLITIVTEEEIKSEQLIHGYVIDEAKTICFLKEYKNNDVFFLCDFSSKIYVKYTKEVLDSETSTSTSEFDNKKEKQPSQVRS